MLHRAAARLAALSLAFAPLQEPVPPAEAGAAPEPSWEDAVGALYAVISGPAGQARDWEAFCAMFAEGANLMISVPEGGGPSRLLVLTPAEYVERSGAMLVELGFSEREIGRRAERFGNVVQVFSAYEGVLGQGAEARKMRGVNAIQWVRTAEGWRIANLLWEAERTGNEVPASLLAKPAETGDGTR